MTDVLDNVPNRKIDCLDKGYVEIVDCMPRLLPEGVKTADFAIVQAARTSYGTGTKTVNEDMGLIRYLLRHSHTTPFEMIEFKFHVKMPILVARQWQRHRMSSTNEYSGRYSQMKDEFYIPEKDNVRLQSSLNKQGGEIAANISDAVDFQKTVQDTSDECYKLYEHALSVGIAREQARMLLPVNNYTEFYWKIDLHNLFHFLGLRCDSHAQQEIRVFADAILALITPIVPMATEAWQDYHDHRGAIKITRLEADAIRKALSGTEVGALESDNKRENSEWVAKAARMGLVIK